MQRWIALLLILACLMGLSGCGDLLFTTSEYRSYQSFVDQHKDGVEKQEILDKLGCPDGYWDALGNYHTIARADHESFEKNLEEDNSTAWVYECWKRPDPADPYRLKITFNIEGQIESAELTLVPGG